jgi:hypothetical protein
MLMMGHIWAVCPTPYACLPSAKENLVLILAPPHAEEPIQPRRGLTGSIRERHMKKSCVARLLVGDRGSLLVVIM